MLTEENFKVYTRKWRKWKISVILNISRPIYFASFINISWTREEKWLMKGLKYLPYKKSKFFPILYILHRRVVKAGNQWCRNRGGRGATAFPALLSKGATGAILPFTFQYNSNEAKLVLCNMSYIYTVEFASQIYIR